MTFVFTVLPCYHRTYQLHFPRYVCRRISNIDLYFIDEIKYIDVSGDLRIVKISLKRLVPSYIVSCDIGCAISQNGNSS